jgi:hypothetical protein
MARHIWVDTNVATSSRMNAFPGGVVGYVNGSTTTDQTGIAASAVDVTSLSVTFTAEAGRLYRTTVYAVIEQNTATSYATVWIMDGSNNAKRASSSVLTATGRATVTVVLLETGLTGSTTRKARASTTAGTLSILNGSNLTSSIIVEDLGVA